MSEKRKQGRPAKFEDGKRTMAVDMSVDMYRSLVAVSDKLTSEANQRISKGDIIRIAIQSYLETAQERENPHA
jgi:hypothetical protein